MPTTSRNQSLCTLKSPDSCGMAGDPTLRNILCVVRMRACTSGVAMLTSGLLRDCGSGAFSKPHGAHTNSATGTTAAAQEPSSTVHVTVLPHTSCPHVRCLLHHGVWWKEPYRTCTVPARYHSDLWVPVTNS